MMPEGQSNIDPQQTRRLASIVERYKRDHGVNLSPIEAYQVYLDENAAHPTYYNGLPNNYTGSGADDYTGRAEGGEILPGTKV